MVPSSIKARIKLFCEQNDVFVPAGFKRHSPSRYVVLVKDDNTWKLIARTWFSVADLLYYVENNLLGREHRIFDFKELNELAVRNSGSTTVIQKIQWMSDG